MKADPLQPSDPQERLEKEKKLTSDLGRAATKLQELLKTTQEQLAKEKDTVKKLQEQLHNTVSIVATGPLAHSRVCWGGLGIVLGTPGLLGSRTNRRHRLGTGGVGDRLLKAASGHVALTLLWLPLVRNMSLTSPPPPTPATSPSSHSAACGTRVLTQTRGSSPANPQVSPPALGVSSGSPDMLGVL